MTTDVVSVKPRILVVPLRYIGDTILTVPLLRNLRRHIPQAHIDLWVSRTAAPLMEPCPYTDRVLIEPKTLRERFSLLQTGRYDQVFILRKSVTFALLAKLAGIARRVGYDKQRFSTGYRRWGWFLTHNTPYPGLRTQTPQAISHLTLLQTAGIPAMDDQLELWSTASDERIVDVLLTSLGIQLNDNGQSVPPLAVLHAASASHGKQIAFDTFAESIQLLNRNGYRVLATGTAQDAAPYEALRQKYGLQLDNLAGKTTLRETFDLYKRIHLLLTVDSSPIHIAAAAGVPHIVGVFGPTNELQWGPHNVNAQFLPVRHDLPCRPCYAKVCAHNSCRELIHATQIAEEVKKAL